MKIMKEVRKKLNRCIAIQSSIFPNLICVINHVDHESCDYHYYVSYEKMEKRETSHEKFYATV